MSGRGGIVDLETSLPLQSSCDTTSQGAGQFLRPDRCEQSHRSTNEEDQCYDCPREEHKWSTRVISEVSACRDDAAHTR